MPHQNHFTIVETGQHRYSILPAHKTHIILHDRVMSWLDTGTSIKSGGVKVVLWAETSLLVK